jgi:hypothetical protein
MVVIFMCQKIDRSELRTQGSGTRVFLVGRCEFREPRDSLWVVANYGLRVSGAKVVL